MPSRIETLRSALRWADRQLTHVATFFAVIGGVCVFLLMAIILVAVFWRYGLNDPIFGNSDVSVMVLSVIAATSVYCGARQNAHVSINLITYFFGRGVTRFTDLIMRSLAVGILGLASFALFDKACGFEKACITENLSIAHRPFYYILGVTMAFFTMHVLVQLLMGLAHFNDPQDPNEVAD